MELSDVIYDMEISDPWWSLMRDGTKKVEGKSYSSGWRHLNIGDKIKMIDGSGKYFFVVITKIVLYKDFGEYLSNEGLEKCLPGIRSLEKGISLYLQWNSTEEIERYSVMAIHVAVL